MSTSLEKGGSKTPLTDAIQNRVCDEADARAEAGLGRIPADRMTGMDADDHGWLRAALESEWRKRDAYAGALVRLLGRIEEGLAAMPDTLDALGSPHNGDMIADVLVTVRAALAHPLAKNLADYTLTPPTTPAGDWGKAKQQSQTGDEKWTVTVIMCRKCWARRHGGVVGDACPKCDGVLESFRSRIIPDTECIDCGKVKTECADDCPRVRANGGSRTSRASPEIRGGTIPPTLAEKIEAAPTLTESPCLGKEPIYHASLEEGRWYVAAPSGQTIVAGPFPSEAEATEYASTINAGRLAETPLRQGDSK